MYSEASTPFTPILNYSNLVLIAQPDSYGRFAHQAFSFLAAWAIAHRTGCFYLPRQFTYFSLDYNRYVDFSLSSRAISALPGKCIYSRMTGKRADQHGNTKYNLSQINDLCSFIAEISECSKQTEGYVLLELPFDQTAGRFFHGLTNEMVCELGKMFKPLADLTYSEYSRAGLTSAHTHISIHIRRGDVTAERHPLWHIDDVFYENLILAFYSLFGDRSRIRVHCESNINWRNPQTLDLQEKRLVVCSRPATSGNIHLSAATDFSHMLNSDILISGQSGYSMLAALVKYGHLPFALVKNEHSYFPQDIDCIYRINAILDLVSVKAARETLLKSNYIKSWLTS